MSELKNLMSGLLPSYSCLLPFKKEKVTFTPFKVKDIKNLSIMLEEDDKNMILKGMVEIIKTNSSGIDVLDLCIADAEYLFLQIRSKSVDEQLNLLYNNTPIKLSINEIGVKNELINSDYHMPDGFSVTLKTPKVKDLLAIDINDETAIIQKAIKKITVNGEVYDIDKYISDDVKELISNLPVRSYNAIKTVLEKSPTLYAVIKIDGEEREVSGSQTFFIFR